jgi:hypothetical protein
VRLIALRRLPLLLVLAVLACIPESALAVAPSNDSIPGAVLLPNAFQPAVTSFPILPSGSLGGWNDAGTLEDNQMSFPLCLGSAGYHSMWYQVDVPESSVLTVSLSSEDVRLYKPLVTIINSTTRAELACGLGGNNLVPNQAVSASSFVRKGLYLVRIASAIATSTSGDDPLPTLTLSEQLRDVTPPQINVAVSKIVGVNRQFTFDASGSTDLGSKVKPASASWSFYDGGVALTLTGAQLGASPLVVKHAWKTAGQHRVTLALEDQNGNKTTYFLSVFVHSFIAPTVSMRVRTPKAGATSVRVIVTHDMPVRVRLVILQDGKVLRTLPGKTVKGFRKSTTLSIALRSKVAKTGFLAVSGTASDLSDFPNTVALKTCTVRPGKGGGVCA